MFDPVVIVATGAEIGLSLGLFEGFPKFPCCMIWRARSLAKTYGRAIIAAVKKADPNAVMLDTDLHGRQLELRCAAPTPCVTTGVNSVELQLILEKSQRYASFESIIRWPSIDIEAHYVKSAKYNVRDMSTRASKAFLNQSTHPSQQPE